MTGGTGITDERLRVARAGLLRLAEPPAPAVGLLVDRLGAVAAFEAVITREAPTAVLSATAARTDGRSEADLRGMAHRDLEVAEAAGARLVCPEDPDWPVAAMVGFGVAGGRGVSGSAPPLAVYVRGGLPSGLPERGITIVGSRASSSYGERVAADIALGIADAGLAVISGGAFGIDTAAHRAAVTSGGRSVAVLACGIDKAYPVANAPLLRRIGETGAVVSEYPPGTTPARHRFLVRNRLLAALGTVTVVVEASRRSGSLSTASAAGHLGRTVMAVPGPVTSAMSAGCHLLLRDRFALLATSAQDVLAAAGPLTPMPFEASGVNRPTDGLDPVALRVHDALPTAGAATVSQLSVSSGVPARDVISALPVLELVGLATRDGASWRRQRCRG